MGGGGPRPKKDVITGNVVGKEQRGVVSEQQKFQGRGPRIVREKVTLL